MLVHLYHQKHLIFLVNHKFATKLTDNIFYIRIYVGCSMKHETSSASNSPSEIESVISYVLVFDSDRFVTLVNLCITHLDIGTRNDTSSNFPGFPQ